MPSSKPNPKVNQDQLQTIDPTALTQVSGGAAAAPATSTNNDQILTALNGILDSIHSLGNQSNHCGCNPQEMLLLMMIMQQHNQQPASVAATGTWPWSPEPIIRYY
jgi:hypothetical protein